MNPIFLDRGQIVTRDHGIVEYTRLLAFWGPPRDPQVGRGIDMKHVRRDLGNNRIVQTPIVAIILDDQRWAARRATARRERIQDRKSTRLNSSHGYISYAVFCLKKKN